MNKAQFKALEREWYAKLKESGFKDIEDTKDEERRLKSWHSFYFQARHDPLSFEHNQEYYSRASAFLHSYCFQSEDEKEIWLLHSEGQTIREIAKRFKNKKGSFSKDSIHNNIRRLGKVMASGDWHEKNEQFELNFNPRRKRRG